MSLPEYEFTRAVLIVALLLVPCLIGLLFYKLR
jgi:hypothetical protein